jgi:xanthine dehydrogenase YagS FAD-binding subunit
MKEFEYINAKTIDEAISLLSEVEDAVAIAGGTDLLTVMKNEILSPKRLVNIKTIPNLDQIKHIGGQGLSIGALSSLSQISKDEMVKDSYGILIQAINRIATPQIRNVGTIGGNLCQKPRCWYYRNPSFQCFRKGGKICFAVRGENRYNAIIDGSPCFMVHPSDLATVLMALDAKIDIVGSDGEKSIPIDDFFVSPKVSLKETNVHLN